MSTREWRNAHIVSGEIQLEGTYVRRYPTKPDRDPHRNPIGCVPFAVPLSLALMSSGSVVWWRTEVVNRG